MAQLAEQLICNQQVNGSSPFIGFYGWVPERPKGADCKSVVYDFGGSNPPSPTNTKKLYVFSKAYNFAVSFTLVYQAIFLSALQQSCTLPDVFVVLEVSNL